MSTESKPPLPEAVREQIESIADGDSQLRKLLQTFADHVREAAAQQARAIACPLCGTTVKQVASATLSLALWQHVHWACVVPVAAHPPPTPEGGQD